jgi:hypothetical protein
MSESPKLPWYVGIYESDDMQSRKDCTAILVYGLPNWVKGNPTTVRHTHPGFKYITLPCPTCLFPHAFKRTEWFETLSLSDYYQVTAAVTTQSMKEETNNERRTATRC